MARPRQRPIGVEYFLPADEWTPELRIARAVIAQAATDVVAGKPEVQEDARRFFIADSEAHEIVRDHWFRTAQLPIPSTEQLARAMGITPTVREPATKMERVRIVWRLWMEEIE